jgi:hypothetical protein
VSQPNRKSPIEKVMRRRLPVYKVWREYKPSGDPLRGKASYYSYTVMDVVPQPKDPRHHIYKRYTVSILSLLTKFEASFTFLRNLRVVLRLGQIISFYSIQWRKIQKQNQAKAGRKTKWAPRTLKKGRPKKTSPIKPTSEQLIEAFKGLKLKQRIGEFTKNSRRIVA